MIISRTPFRVSLAGGGSDLAAYYRQRPGNVVTMAINRYMYVTVNRRFDDSIRVSYTRTEIVDRVDDLHHDLIRESMKMTGLTSGLEITTIADLPAGIGLGSSSTLTVGVLNALYAMKGEWRPQDELARRACEIEIEVLGKPIGKQDQYIAAFGGFRTLDIAKDGRVTVSSVPVDFMTATELAQKARMYYTGIQRSATAVLKTQDAAAKAAKSPDHARVVDSLSRIKEIGHGIRKAFEQRDLDTFGRLMDEHWRCKKQMSGGITLTVIEELYEKLKKDFGVLGGKIIGAGGGGFLMLYCPSKGRELDAFMKSHDMPPVSYFPSMEGARVVSDMTSHDDFDALG